MKAWFVLEDVQQEGMYYMDPALAHIPAVKTFENVKDADEFLWKQDCLFTMAYRVTLIGTPAPRMFDNEGGL
jgi:hypothetical protein